jgi:hypothetical protein
VRTIALLAIGAAAANPAAPAPTFVVPAGQQVALAQRRVAEKPTVFVFLKPSSTLEQVFLDRLRRDVAGNVGFGIIRLKSGSEPIARQYEVKVTPTALVYDRRGRLVTRSSDPAAIQAAVKKAAGMMRIDWAEEGDPRLEEVARIRDGNDLVRVRDGKRPVPGIMRTMSLKPEYMAFIHGVAQKAHFADGFLDRRTKEMIATHVSALNKCKY